jgi:prepilin-type N-terminal cleavage/methylation domain-containing protein
MSARPSDPGSFTPTCGGRLPRAFTLVELIIVIGIVLILIGLALPSLGRTREMTKELRDLSQLRNASTLVVQYTTDQAGVFPVASDLPIEAAQRWFQPLIDTGLLSRYEDLGRSIWGPDNLAYALTQTAVMRPEFFESANLIPEAEQRTAAVRIS